MVESTPLNAVAYALSIRGITALSSQILGNSCSILVLNQSISAFSSKLALVNARTPYNIAQGTVCAKVASENLVCLVRVSRLGRADSDSMCTLSRHGGGGAGETGDGHCRGGCHGYEAFVEPCSLFSLSFLFEIFGILSYSYSVIAVQGSEFATLRTTPPSPRRFHHCRLLRLKARPTTAIATARNPAAYILFTPSPPVPGRTTPGVLVMEPPSTVNAADF